MRVSPVSILPALFSYCLSFFKCLKKDVVLAVVGLVLSSVIGWEISKYWADQSPSKIDLTKTEGSLTEHVDKKSAEIIAEVRNYGQENLIASDKVRTDVSIGSLDIISRLNVIDITLKSIKDISSAGDRLDRSGTGNRSVVSKDRPFQIEDGLKKALSDLFNQKIQSYKQFYAKYPNISMNISELTPEVAGVGVGRCTLVVTVSSASGKFMNHQTVKGQATTTKSDSSDIAHIACGNAIDEIVSKVTGSV